MSDPHPSITEQLEDSTLRVDFGDRAFDTVTGFRGIVTAVVLYDHNSPEYLLEGTVEGRVRKEWFPGSRVAHDKLSADLGPL